MTTITTTKLFAVMPLAFDDDSTDDLLIDRELTQAPLRTQVFNYWFNDGTPVRLTIDHYYLLNAPSEKPQTYVPPECCVYTLDIGDECVAIHRVQKVKLHPGARQPEKYIFRTDAGELTRVFHRIADTQEFYELTSLDGQTLTSEIELRGCRDRGCRHPLLCNCGAPLGRNLRYGACENCLM